ncbi:MAG: hypothetical protein ACE5EX_03405 [Phycisphaerae bacterium]
MEKADDTPYCRECGYSLVGLTESSKCPECGRPIIEVLVRDSFGGQGKRYTSARKLFNLPLVAIATGPYGRETYGSPVGIIALGDRPRGVVAIGGAPVGFIAIGGIARGVIAIGGFAIGLLGLGGFTVGVLALGGFAIGGWAYGGFAGVIFGGMGGTVLRLWPW